MKSENKYGLFLIRILEGILVGVGAVLPGISGGVLCVIFGIYKPVMQFLAHPFKTFKKNMLLLAPVAIGVIIGFLGISKILAFFLETYPNQSVCLFVGLIGGMMPSLFREAGEQGRTKGSFISLFAAMAIIFALLITLGAAHIEVVPNVGWYLFCGFCLAMSLIAPGMSFSTLLMPLGLYTPFIAGIGSIDMSVLVPAGIAALATIILLSKGVNYLFENHYSIAFYAICGIVIAATVMIIPFGSFTESVSGAAVNLGLIIAGIILALLLDKFNQKIDVKNAEV